MSTYKRFEDLPVWQEAARLYSAVLDLLEEPGLALSPGFRNQLDRAALSVSNNIAEGFERVTTNELLAFLAIARGSAGEVRSMMAVILERSKLKPSAAPAARDAATVFLRQPHTRRLQEVRALAESCARQLTAWTGSVEDSPVQGKRHLTGPVRAARQTAQSVQKYRQKFLADLKPGHPLYQTTEARAARGELVEP